MNAKKTKILKWIGAALVIAVIALTCRVTVIPDEVPQTFVNENGETIVVEKLSVAEQYCADNWDTRVLPTIKERAVEITTFIKDAQEDLNATGVKYGNRANETSAWSFCLKGNANVIDIENVEKATKTRLVLDLEPYDGQANCILHFGKVFPSTIKNAIRDGVGFLHLDDFENQVEFADITTAFNDRVKADIFSQFTPADLVGKTINFYGCMSLTSAEYENYVIIPVEIVVAEDAE